MHSRVLALLRVVALLFTVGCFTLSTGCGGEAKTVPVSGKVLLDGKAITVEKPKEAAVNFYADESKGNTLTKLPVAMVDASGTYTLTTNGKPGAPVGWYKVTVNYSTPANPKDEYSVRTRLVNEKYVDPKTTPLTIEVKDGAGPDAYDLKVTK